MDIVKTREALKDILTVVNMEEKLRVMDWKAVAEELWDCDEHEATQLATDLGLLDLNNDSFEMVVKEAALKYGPYAAFALKLLKLFLPKP